MLLLVAAVAYHLQSVTAYCTMDLVSPVTMSVANCAKRGLLILLSVLYFGNEVRLSTWVGMVMIILGVFGYNKARTMQREVDKKVHDDGVLPFVRPNGNRQ